MGQGIDFGGCLVSVALATALHSFCYYCDDVLRTYRIGVGMRHNRSRAILYTRTEMIAPSEVHLQYHKTGFWKGDRKSRRMRNGLVTECSVPAKKG